MIFRRCVLFWGFGFPAFKWKIILGHRRDICYAVILIVFLLLQNILSQTNVVFKISPRFVTFCIWNISIVMGLYQRVTNNFFWVFILSKFKTFTLLHTFANNGRALIILACIRFRMLQYLYFSCLLWSVFLQSRGLQRRFSNIL